MTRRASLHFPAAPTREQQCEIEAAKNGVPMLNKQATVTMPLTATHCQCVLLPYAVWTVISLSLRTRDWHSVLSLCIVPLHCRTSVPVYLRWVTA